MKPSVTRSWKPLLGLCLALATLMVSAPVRFAGALETDQYMAWNRPLTDSTEVLNAWFNLRLQEIVREANARAQRPDPWGMTVAMERSLRAAVVVHFPDDYAQNSPLVDRVPRDPGEELDFWDESIYGGSPPLAPAKLMPLAPTVEAAGIRFGLDKLAHFVSVGWLYFKELHDSMEEGMPERSAIGSVIRKGIDSELIYLLGYRVSGVFSISDLEADYQGMLFYRDLCGGPDPVLQWKGGRWIIRHPIDLRRYITPEWDESYEPIVYSPRKWKSTRPRLEALCGQLDSPWLKELWATYEHRDRLTPTERAVAQAVEQGRIPDPRQFTLPAVCGRRPRSFGSDMGFNTVLAPAKPVPGEVLEEVSRDESERRRHLLLGWQAGWYEPLGPAASLGLLAASGPARSDCHVACFMDGPFAKATAGPGGGTVSIGWATVNGRIGRGGHSLDATWLGLSVRGALLRTWRPYASWRANRTYAGAQLEASIARFSFTLGAMRRIAGGPNDHWLLTWGVAWGF